MSQDRCGRDSEVRLTSSSAILLRKTNKLDQQSCPGQPRSINLAPARGRRLKEATLSLLALRRFVSGGVHRVCLPVFFALAATNAAYPQAAEPKITSVVVFPQAASTTSTQDFVLEIKGTGFAALDMNNVHVV